MATRTVRDKVFVSYSHKDMNWLDRLRVHVEPLQQEGRSAVWDGTQIKAGEKWHESIEQAVRSARVAVLLVSADFLASKFIRENELPPLLAAAQKNGCVILPLIVKPCRFTDTEGLKDFQAVNPPSRSLIEMSEGESEATFVTLANRISEVFAKDSGDDANAGQELAATEEDVSQPEVFHPARRWSTRSKLEPCTFYISPFFKERELWQLYGDILVELRQPSPTGRIYLIPSGAVNPHLRDTKFLRSSSGKTVVRSKQNAAILFVDECKNRELEGYKFVMTTKDKEERVKVYCATYDVFLRRHAKIA